MLLETVPWGEVRTFSDVVAPKATIKVGALQEHCRGALKGTFERQQKLPSQMYIQIYQGFAMWAS